MVVLVRQQVLQVNYEYMIVLMYLYLHFKRLFVHVHQVIMVVVVNFVIIVYQVHGNIKL
jgi:hypothetical protein